MMMQGNLGCGVHGVFVPQQHEGGAKGDPKLDTSLCKALVGSKPRVPQVAGGLKL